MDAPRARADDARMDTTTTTRLAHCTPTFGGHSPLCDRDGTYCQLFVSHEGPCNPHGPRREPVAPFCSECGQPQTVAHDHGWVDASFCDQCGRRFGASPSNQDCIGCGSLDLDPCGPQTAAARWIAAR